MNYLADLQLDLELLASKMISGMIFPTDYINIRTNFCKLEMLKDISDEVTNDLNKLQEIMKTNFGNLEDDEVQKFFEGKHPKVLKLLNKIKKDVDEWIPVYGEALIEKGAQNLLDLEEDMSGQDFVGMAEAINSNIYKVQELDNIRVTEIQLKVFKGILDALIPLYGTSLGKIPNVHITPSLGKKYQLFINDLLMNADVVAGNLEMAIVLGKVLQSIQKIFPQEVVLDPYKTQVHENLLKILTHPKNYYKECKNNSILNDTIPFLFSNSYSAIFQKFMSIYLDSFDKMDYTEQTVFRKCFILPPDNTKLLSLSNQYIKLGYT